MKNSFRKQNLMNNPILKKPLMIGVLAALLTACNGGSKGHADPNAPTASVNELDPGSIAADAPPTEGHLPAELLPPAQG